MRGSKRAQPPATYREARTEWAGKQNAKRELFPIRPLPQLAVLVGAKARSRQTADRDRGAGKDYEQCHAATILFREVAESRAFADNGRRSARGCSCVTVR